jgi:hypothetical protein
LSFLALHALPPRDGPECRTIGGRGFQMLRGRYGVGWMIVAWIALATLIFSGLLVAVWLLPMVS